MKTKSALILLIDKPVGLSSFDCIRELKRTFPGAKFGHAGTLDPRASGLLVVGMNEGTKLMARMVGLPKEYETEVLFGMRTDTGDMEGKPVQKQAVSSADLDALPDALAGMVGTLSLPVPVYSAVKRGGEPLYKKARRGEQVEPPVKDMQVEWIHAFDEAREHEKGIIVPIRMRVGSGTYVRSLAEELGRRLGVPATVYTLRRTRVGSFSVEDARPLDQIGEEEEY